VAVGALEVGARRALLFLGLDLDADLVQLVLDDIDHHLVVDVEVAVLGLATVLLGHHAPLVDELLLLEVDQMLVHELEVHAQQLGQVLLLHARIEQEHLHAQVQLEAVEGAHDHADEGLEVGGHDQGHGAVRVVADHLFFLRS